ncbi:unnamed protein product [Dovyalis caffra]|uniref:Uncharacterized protein n=1 Tax=Dovyalis caffra TaxID=77055 RepID=A0AAV1RWY2_9ROSI|nr:unnamed protein product [Dovyalis caffra]
MHRVESPTQGDGDAKPVETVGPCILFFPSHTTEEEWNNIMNFAENGVGWSGSAAMGKMGPIVGSVDIGESDDAYFFGSLFLVWQRMKVKEFSCDIKPDGKVLIKGVTTADSKSMSTGSHSISFLLPGPVYPQPISSNSGINGMLEMIVGFLREGNIQSLAFEEDVRTKFYPNYFALLAFVEDVRLIGAAATLSC